MPHLINPHTTQDTLSLLQYAERQPWLLILSVFVAVLSSALALQVSGQTRMSRRAAARGASLGSGTVAVAVGIWAMHFISLQAINWPFAVAYDWRLTALSFVPSVLTAWSMLRLFALDRAQASDVLQTAALLAVGIGVMQLMGYAAVQLPMKFRYVPFVIAENLIINLVLATAALSFRFVMRHPIAVQNVPPLARVWSSALVLGLAMVAMQMLPLTGFNIPSDTYPSPLKPDWGMRDAIGTGIALATVVLLSMVSIGNELMRSQELLSQANASETRWRSTLNTLTDAIILFDERGLVQTMNPAGLRLFGRTAEEVHDLRVPDLLRDVAGLGLMRLTQHQQAIPPSWETQAYRKSREPAPVLLSVGEVALPHARWYVAQVSDMSPRKAMEQALHESEDRMRNLIRNTPGMAFSVRLPDRSTVYVSEGSKLLTGWAPADFTERKLKLVDMVHPSDRETYRQQVRATLQDHTQLEIEFRLIHRQGHTMWIMGRGNVTRNAEGHVQSLDGLLLDITEQKKTEMALRANEAQMRTLVANIPGVVLRSRASAPYAVHFASDAIRTLTGWPAHAFVQGIIRLENLLAPAEAEHAIKLRNEAIAQHTSYEAELRLCRRDGHEVWIQARGRAEYDEHGQPVWIDSVLLDITRAKQLELTLKAQVA